MNFLNDWMQSDWLRALGWTFVHSLWQIAITGLLLYIILRLIPGRSAHVRYTIATMAIWMIVLMALSTFIIMLPDSTSITKVTGQVIMLQSTTSLSITDRLSLWLESNMPMMLTVWLGGVMILLIRLLLSLGWVSHMRSTAEVSLEIQQSLDAIIQRLQLKIKPVASESIHVMSPVTIGYLKPLILFPIGIINQLTPGEVEAVITHELAHIVRRDYLSNLIQSFIETLFYYHPVTWWISGVVRTERENRADDLAISWYGDHLGYAKALMTVQEMQAVHNPLLAIGFASRKGAMLARIQRILHIPYKNHNQMEKTVLLSLCSLCFLAFTLTGNADNKTKNKSDKNDLMRTVTVDIKTDTIPAEGTYRIHKKTDDQEINIEVENGDIKKLSIDGKEIAPSEFNEYDDVIDELFGEIEAPPAMEGFYFETPAMPPMPAVPGMPHLDPMAPMPPMPPMTPMQKMEIERFYKDGNIAIGNGENFKHKFFIDTLGETRIIIIGEGGDSSVVIRPGGDFKFRHGYGPAIELEEFRMNADEWKKHEKEWKKMSEEWQQNWQEHSQEWQQEWQAHQEEMKELQKQLKENELMFREGEIEGHLRFNEKQLEELEGLYGVQGPGKTRIYGMRAPGMRITDALVEEGLIAPGEEAEVVLTPDKLKINGKKMDDETHKKYLKMYEAQQGVELTGNSRVEFRTKSRRSM
jgi:bla regulator protein blaR1